MTFTIDPLQLIPMDENYGLTGLNTLQTFSILILNFNIKLEQLRLLQTAFQTDFME